MEFNSHTSDVVYIGVAVVNALTPGWARGRSWDSEQQDRMAAAEQALSLGRRKQRRISSGEVDELAGYATSLREVFEYVDSADMDAACEHVNGLLQSTGAVPVLARHDGEPWHLHFHAEDAPFAQAWAAAMATALAIVLGGTFADRIGVCSAPACDRVYVDTSRNGTRRFCSTACQNRVKAAAFRERRAASRAAED